MIRTLRRVVGIGLAWGILWVAVAMIVGIVIGIVDPESIDPGEGPMVVAAVIGPMGFLSGAAFAILLSIGSSRRADSDLSLTRAAAWGILGSAIVQLAYLGHGDLGLVANIKMASLFCAVGGVVAIVWLVLARRWSHRPSSQSQPPGAT